MPLVLRPLLPVKTVPEQLDEPLIKMDFQSLPDLLREVGYAATASVPDCQKILQVFSSFFIIVYITAKLNQVCSAIDAPTIARSLFIMGRTYQVI